MFGTSYIIISDTSWYLSKDSKKSFFEKTDQNLDISACMFD
uniref:Uncharacterized protein n=1 Tax=Arundo donax TaxID=35708 RepID=A0A0A8YSH0_ARUDO